MLTLRHLRRLRANLLHNKFIVMANQFKTIGIISKTGDPSVAQCLRDLIQYLQQRKLTLLLDRHSHNLIPDIDATVPVVDRKTLGEGSDLAIVIGGDGTILHMARSLVDYEVPILGINQGRLGFLADISPTEFSEKLDRILDGEYDEESRTMLAARVTRGEKLVGESNALNDVVIHSCNVARMIEYETYLNDKFVHRSNADGLIVSTPTGSTAYALSGGGPIVHPTLKALILVTVCPHTMSHRPIVVNDDNKIRIIFGERNQARAQVSCDGQVDIPLVNGDRIDIQRHPKGIRLIHPKNYNYYSILRAKLHWGKRLKPD